MSQHLNKLPPQTAVDGYTIEATLGGGGFSNVYLAREQATGRYIVIKEYMPARLARRNPDHSVTPLDAESADAFNRGLKLFLQEARALATLKHPNIINVTNFVRAYGTAYMVMEYEEGKNLQQYIRNRKGRLSDRFLFTVFPPLLEGLRQIHEHGYLHLDIKPPNIHLRQGGRPLLLDFGAVHQAHMSRQEQPGRVVSPGYSPIEQYEPNGYVGPWTDLYAIGATMRACIEGRAPPAAVARQERECMKPAELAFRKRYPLGLLRAIDWAMEVDPLLRPQSVNELLAALNEEVEEEIEPPPEGVFGRLAGSLPWGKD